ncbi:4-amino-4-deoxy-L-arabinose transferase-like glycosyltransferase [Bradyrhizobium sp. AZCC 1588]|uniref:glycosyltransferase family 39 protein n=1 Tax=unclassified Bradyrhizobium TaxID=2631580 RepID=UPI002FF29AD5
MFIDFSFRAAAKRSDRCPAPWRRPLIQWLDGVEAGWSIPLLLVCFVAVWMAYLSISYLGAGLHPDVLETWTFGRTLAWGNPKHPPLMGWVTRAWTTVFPLTDWSLQLMAMTNAALGLWFVDRISKRLVVGHKRLIVLLLLMLTPAYQFHAQRFNANTVLLATWPLATYCFLRAFETKKAFWAIAAGLSAALTILGKYYSVFLIASFAFAAIAHPHRRAYLLSASPWISVAVGSVALSPHLYWLATTGAAPVHHALTHAGVDALTSLRDAAAFLLGLAAAMGVSAVTWIMIAGYRLKRMPRELAAMSPNLVLLGFIAIGTIGLPIAVALLMRTDLPSLWALQGLFLFAVVIVCSTSYPIERFYTVNATVLVAAIAATAVIVAAPVHAIYRNRCGYKEDRNFYHRAAKELTRQWRALTGSRLTVIGGNDSLGLATAFYSPDHPHYGRPVAYQYALELPRGIALENGWAALCFEHQSDCIDEMQRMTKDHTVITRKLTLQSRLFGMPGVVRTVVAFMVVPRGTLARDADPKPVNASARPQDD